MPKADMAVYRDQTTLVAYVSPGSIIVSKSKDKSVVFRNYTDEVVDITLDSGTVQSQQHLDRRTDPGHGRGSLPIDLFDPGAYEITVMVGKDKAIGHSSPVIIIDD